LKNIKYLKDISSVINADFNVNIIKIGI